MEETVKFRSKSHRLNKEKLDRAPRIIISRRIKALKVIMWFLSRRPIKGIDNLKKKEIKHNNIRRTSLDGQAKARIAQGRRDFGMNTAR